MCFRMDLAYRYLMLLSPVDTHSCMYKYIYNVHYSLVAGPPQWDSEPKDVWALDGWGLNLGWGVHASPPATLVWFRDGLELRASSSKYDTFFSYLPS